MANIGTAKDSGSVRVVTGIPGVDDNDIVIQLDEADSWNEFCLTTSAGIVDVDVSLDGTNYIAAIALEDKKATAPATRVIVTAAAGLYYFFGCFKVIRVLQNTATDAIDTVLICRNARR